MTMKGRRGGPCGTAANTGEPGFTSVVGGLCALALGIGLVSGSAAVPIDLGGLTGTYAIGEGADPGVPAARSTVFAVPDSIGGLEGLRFVVAGTWESAFLEQCRDLGDGNVVCDTVPTPTNLTLRLSSAATGECHFQATVAAGAGIDGDVAVFEVCPSGSVGFGGLLGTPVSAELYCDVPPEDLVRYVQPGQGEVMDAHLETVGAVRTDGPTWGGLKARFR
jgi:hypothetical protein